VTRAAEPTPRTSTETPGGQHHITRIAQGQQVRGPSHLRLKTADRIEDLRIPIGAMRHDIAEIRGG
jgi:hypothetical protein